MEPRRSRRPGTLVAPALVAALAIVIAGCDPFAGPTTGPTLTVVTPTPSPSPSPTPTPRPTPTVTPRPTATPTPTLPLASAGPTGSTIPAAIGPCPGRTATAASGPLDTASSTNWSGYAATLDSPKVGCVEATWVQPTVACSKSNHTAISLWVGIGGFDQDALVQVGSEIDCDNGHLSHFLWHESLPKERFEQRLELTVRAGDHLRARVRAVSSTRYEVAIANLTRHTSFRVVDTNTRLKATSGEWILEAPTGGCPDSCRILPMPNFHAFTFRDTWVSVAGVRQPLDGAGFSHVRVRMVTKGGTIRSQVTSTASDGSFFVVTWRRS
jgi:hypothetical protein